uniref:Alternative protein SENP6 n=3 Tax=Catarrhini TaxID=9526 RepID=L8E9U8_HUMAN|nr:alternative protein SENP6 [Homo sapiens]
MEVLKIIGALIMKKKVKEIQIKMGQICSVWMKMRILKPQKEKS